ncbi:MAG: RT0821/Lpp0805 family surface protein [Alphaproteobacteria bacterium]
MPSAAIPQAIAIPAVLAAALAVAACEPPPPVELGPQGSGGIVSGFIDPDNGDPQTGDETGDELASADPGTTGDAGAGTTQAAAPGSVLDAGKGAAFAAQLAPDDSRYFQQAELSARNALIGSTITWRNPGSGTVGTITPLNDRTIGGQQCRDFFMTATISGRQRSETATACRSGNDWVPRA